MQTLTYNGKTYTCPYIDLLPPLTAAELGDLREDIRANGITNPVVVTDAGEVLDGHHRLGVAIDLGLPTIPIVGVGGLTEAQKRARAVALNVHRRHLTPDLRAQLIESYLRADPGRSDRSVAEELRVDHKTVGVVRKRLVTTGDIPHSDARTGRDGKTRACRPRLSEEPLAEVAVPSSHEQAQSRTQVAQPPLLDTDPSRLPAGRSVPTTPAGTKAESRFRFLADRIVAVADAVRTMGELPRETALRQAPEVAERLIDLANAVLKRVNGLASAPSSGAPEVSVAVARGHPGERGGTARQPITGGRTAPVPTGQGPSTAAVTGSATA